MERLSKFFGILMVGFVLSGVTMSGQTTSGGVSGTVSDASGRVIPGVGLTLTNQETGITATASTNSSGFYTFVNVAPGQYTLQAQKTGFSTVSVPSFEVTVNGTVTENLTLTVGQVNQTVSVTAAEPLLQASSSQISTVIDQKAIQDLPMNGRNFTEMILLTPGVSPVSTTQEWGLTVALPSSSWIKPDVGGQWGRSNVYYMDGFINTEGETGSYAILPSLDAVKEFSVESHGDQAEFGLVMGGVVNLVSKSGTNSFHGTAYDYVRNNIFDARNGFTDIGSNSAGSTIATPVAAYRQNQFGATLGGPVIIPKLFNGKNKMFFFFNYDGWRYATAAQSLYYSPTTAALNGDLSAFLTGPDPIQIYDPATTRVDPVTGNLIRDPFPGNIIPPDRLNQMMVKTLQLISDKPNLPNEFPNNTVNNVSNTNDTNAFQARIDWQATDKAHLLFRFNHLDNTNFFPTTLTNGEDVDTNPTQYALEWDQLLSPNLILASRIATTGHPNFQVPSNPISASTWSGLGWSQISRYGGAIIVNAGVNQAISGDPYNVSNERNYQASQDLSWVKKNHQMKFGYLYFRQHWWGNDPYAGADFNTDQTDNPQEGDSVTGLALASALLGLPNDTFGNDQVYDEAFTTWGFYAQDQWKATKNLTVNYSLRWEFVTSPDYMVETPGDFDYSSGNYWIGGKSLPQACGPNGPSPCIPGGSLAAIPGGNHITLAPRPNIVPPHRKNLEPRLGFAWQFFPKTVLSAGAGMAYDVFSGMMQQNNNIQAQWPNNNYGGDLFNQVGPLDSNPLTAINTAEGQGLSFLPDPSGPWNSMLNNNYFDPNKKPPYSIEYNLRLEHEFGQNTTVSAAYVGSVSRRLDYGIWANADKTPSVTGPRTYDQMVALSPFPYIPGVFPYSLSTGNGSYNSLQIKVNRRYSNGLTYLVAYTWSKSEDNGNSGWFGAENGASGGSSIQNEYDPKSNWGISGYDVPQVLTVGGGYDLPVGKGKRWLRTGALSSVLGDWRLNVIQSIHSSAPYNPLIDGDLANVGRVDSYMRPNLVGNPKPKHPTIQQWLNPAAFDIPNFTFGDMGRNSLRGAPFFQTDTALAKTFPIHDSLNLEFRAEAFNVFNEQNYGLPDYDMSDPTFGQVQYLAGNPRQLQFSGRINF